MKLNLVKFFNKHKASIIQQDRFKEQKEIIESQLLNGKSQIIETQMLNGKTPNEKKLPI